MPSDLAERAIRVIQERYDNSGYLLGIESITDPEQRLYGAIDKPHTKAVLSWVRKLWQYGEAPDALQISAAGHDWDRAFEYERDKLESYPHVGSKPVEIWYSTHKAMHSANTTRILRRELTDLIPKDLMNDIIYLVLLHEIGGRKNPDCSLVQTTDLHTGTYNLNEAADVLQQADSLAFFDVLDIYVDWRKPDKVKQKIGFMFDRIKDPKVRQLISELTFQDPRAIKIFNEVIKGN
jgi:hypothetical protein